MTADIFFGVIHYQRLRHMVSDKFQVRISSKCQIDKIRTKLFDRNGVRKGGGRKLRLGTIHKIRQHFFSDFWHPPPPCQQLSAFQYPLPKKYVSICQIESLSCSFVNGLNFEKKNADIIILETPTPLMSSNVNICQPPPPLKSADVLYGWSLSLYVHIPHIYFELGLQIDMDLAFVCP